MSLPLDSRRIVIAGASSLLGAELRSLLEESRFADWDFRLLDEELAAGTLTEAAGEPVLIQPVAEDSFSHARLTFFTGSAQFTQANLESARHAGGAVIDLSGGSLGHSQTRLWYPRAEIPLERDKIFAVLSAPSTVAVSLLDALNRIGLHRLGLIFFRPVSEAGSRGIEELESQTSQLLSLRAVGQPVFDTQVAFALTDRYGLASRECLFSVRDRIRKEVEPLVGNCGVIPSIQVIHAPVFYGYAFAALAESSSALTSQKIAEVCKAASFLIWNKADGPLSNLSAGDHLMRLALPDQLLGPAGSWWCWGVVDNIKLPASSAVQLAEALVA